MCVCLQKASWSHFVSSTQKLLFRLCFCVYAIKPWFSITYLTLTPIHLIGVRDVNDLSNVQKCISALSYAFNPQTGSHSAHHWVRGVTGQISPGTPEYDKCLTSCSPDCVNNRLMIHFLYFAFVCFQLSFFLYSKIEPPTPPSHPSIHPPIHHSYHVLFHSFFWPFFCLIRAGKAGQERSDSPRCVWVLDWNKRLWFPSFNFHEGIIIQSIRLKQPGSLSVLPQPTKHTYLHTHTHTPTHSQSTS